MNRKRDVFYDLGRILDKKDELLRLFDADLATHVAVLGGTGQGKSYLLRQLVREHVEQGIGIAVFEPGDLCDDVLADMSRKVVQKGNKDVLKSIHYLRASPFQCFRYDSFHFRLHRSVHPELMDSVRRSWAHCKVQTIAEIFQVKGTGSTDFEGQPRVQRMLTNVLYAAATLVDGRRLSLSDARILLDLHHPVHDAVYERLKPRLPRDVVADLEILHGLRRLEDFRRETESCMNRLRSLFSPLLSAVLSASGHHPSVDLFDIIQKGHCLLVPLQEDQFFSHDQKLAMSALLLHDLVETLLTTPRELRRPFTIVLDEAGEFAVTERAARWLSILRKYGGRLVFSGQDLSTFRRKEFDMRPRLLSQCGTVVSFNQKWPEDTEILARVMCSGKLDFTPLVHEVERHGGYTWHAVRETSRSMQEQVGVGRGHTDQRSETDSHQEGKSTTHTNGSASTASAHASHTDSLSRPVLDPSGITGNRHTGDSSGTGSSSTTSAAQADGNTVTDGKSTMHGSSDSTTVTAGTGIGISESQKLVPLADVVREPQETGKLQTAIPDQWAKLQAMFPGLPKRRALVKLATSPEAFQIETLEIREPYASVEAQVKAVEWVKRELYALHPYFFTPNLDPAEEDGRLREFLGLAPEEDGSLDEADEPLIVERYVSANDDLLA